MAGDTPDLLLEYVPPAWFAQGCGSGDRSSERLSAGDECLHGRHRRHGGVSSLGLRELGTGVEHLLASKSSGGWCTIPPGRRSGPGALEAALLFVALGRPGRGRAYRCPVRRWPAWSPATPRTRYD